MASAKYGQRSRVGTPGRSGGEAADAEENQKSRLQRTVLLKRFLYSPALLQWFNMPTHEWIELTYQPSPSGTTSPEWTKLTPRNCTAIPIFLVCPIVSAGLHATWWCESLHDWDTIEPSSATPSGHGVPRRTVVEAHWMAPLRADLHIPSLHLNRYDRHRDPRQHQQDWGSRCNTAGLTGRSIPAEFGAMKPEARRHRPVDVSVRHLSRVP